MFITSHVLAGRIVGRLLPGRPFAALGVGVLSHLAMDAMPHWSPGKGSAVYDDFVRVAKRDGVVGLGALALSLLATPRDEFPVVASAIFGAAVVDMDKPMQYFFGVNPFPRWFQWLHKVIQDEEPTRLKLEIGVAGALASTILLERVLKTICQSRPPQTARGPMSRVRLSL